MKGQKADTPSRGTEQFSGGLLRSARMYLHEWNNEGCLYEIKGACICSSPRGFLRTRVASGNEEEVVYCKPFGGEYWIGRTW